MRNLLPLCLMHLPSRTVPLMQLIIARCDLLPYPNTSTFRRLPLLTASGHPCHPAPARCPRGNFLQTVVTGYYQTTLTSCSMIPSSSRECRCPCLRDFRGGRWEADRLSCIFTILMPLLNPFCLTYLEWFLFP